MQSSLHTLDLLQVDEAKAFFLLGWVVGNEVKNKFVQNSDEICPTDIIKWEDFLIYTVL